MDRDITPTADQINWGPRTSQEMVDQLLAICDRHWDIVLPGLKDLEQRAFQRELAKRTKGDKR